jgi:hypothetical protein
VPSSGSVPYVFNIVPMRASVSSEDPCGPFEGVSADP